MWSPTALSFESSAFSLLACQRSWGEADMIHDVNVEGTRTVARVAYKFGAPPLILSYSSAVYDCSVTERRLESSGAGPISPYGRSKFAVETCLREMARFV